MRMSGLLGGLGVDRLQGGGERCVYVRTERKQKEGVLISSFGIFVM